MIRRCEPPRRRYTELCNRSGCTSPPPSQPYRTHTPTTDSLEDYWEDASVSIRSCRSWDPSSTSWLHASSAPSPHPDSDNAERHGPRDPVSRRFRPCRYSFDASDPISSAKGRRCFPPPLASCSTLSIKEGGRFVLKEMDAERPHGFFRAQRENGRLRLQLILPEEPSDEAAASESDENDIGGSDDGVIDEEEDNASVIECSEGSMGGISDQSVFQDAAQDLLSATRRSRVDCISSEEDVMGRNGADLSFDGPQECDQRASGMLAWEDGGLHESRHSPTVLADGALNIEGTSGFLGRKDVGEEAGEWLAGGNAISADVNNVEAQSRFGGGLDEASPLPQQEPLWDVDAVSRALPGLDSWSPNQLCIRPTLIKMSTVCGLAMS